jgi:3'-5' exoribonuclease
MTKTLKQHEPGEKIDAICVLAGLTVRQTRQQKPFLRLELNDSGGRVDAVMWDGFDEELTRTPLGQVLRVHGRMEAYDDRPQVIVNSISVPASGSYDPSALMPSSERDPAEMLSELDKIIASVEHPLLRKLIEVAFSEDNFRVKFTQAPAAKRWHQAYIGGLLEHTLNVVAHARALAVRYSEIENDLVIAGALLHDIGKISEYSWDGYLDSSTEGRLVGHLVIGVELLNGWIGQIDNFPKPLAWQLKHLILSHHGSLEFGSPVPPRTLEALVVHYADDLDSKVSGVLKIRNRQLDAPGEWTEYIRLMETQFFKSSVFEDPVEATAVEKEKSAPKADGKPADQPVKPTSRPHEQSLFGGDEY